LGRIDGSATGSKASERDLLCKARESTLVSRDDERSELLRRKGLPGRCRSSGLENGCDASGDIDLLDWAVVVGKI
jgi:hypothetical protein